MPTFQIQTDKGTFEIEADREPTQEEALQAVASQASPPVQNPAPAATAPNAGLPSPQQVQMSAPAPNGLPLGLAPGDAQPNPAQIAQMRQAMVPGATAAQADTIQSRAKRVAMAAPSVALPLGLAPFTGGASIPAAVAMGTAGVLGGRISNAIRGEKPALSDDARAFIMSGMPVVRPIAAPLMSMRGMGNAAIGAGAVGGTAALANYVGATIDKGTLTPFNDYKEAFNGTILPAIIGAGTLGIAGKLKSASALQAEADAGKQAAQALGMADPALGDVLPKQFGGLQARVAAVYPQIAAKVNQARSPIIKGMYAMIGDAPMNETIASELQPLVGKMDEADAAYAAATDRMAKAKQTMDLAQTKVGLTPQQLSDVRTGAQAEIMSALSDQAKANIAADVLGGTIGTQTGKAEAMGNVVKVLFGARSQAASDLIAKTGINPNAAVFDRDTLLNAAKMALGGDSESFAGKSIISTIENWGNKTGKDAVLARTDALNQKLRQAALTGRQLSVEESRAIFAPPKGQLYDPKVGGFVKPAETPAAAPTDPGFLSLEDFKRLRDGISNGFIGKLDSNNMNNAERLASKAYAAMGDAHVGQIGQIYGPEAEAGYQQFKNFWRDTSQLRDSDFGRALLTGEISDSTIGGMADKLANGNVDEIANFKKFVDILRPQNADVANNAMSAMGSAVRNSFLQKATDEAGNIDYRKLGNLLQSTVSKPDFPFPIQQFRLGDAPTIAGWQKALQTFRPSDLTPDAIRSVMESPQIQSALQVGGKDIGPRIKTLMAEKAFQKRVNDATMLKEAGATKQARDAFAEAGDFARQAGIDAQTAQTTMQAAEQNPLLAVFRGKGSYRLTNEAENTGPNSITGLVGGMKRQEAQQLMTALRAQKPDLAEMVQRRLLANEMGQFTRDEARVPGAIYGIDPLKVRQYFDPPPGEMDTRLGKLTAVVGPEVMSKFKKFAQGLAQFDDAARQATITAKVPVPMAQGVGFGGMVQSGSVQRGRSLQSALTQAVDFYRAKKFNLLSATLLDDGFANQLSRNSGSIADALSSLPAQKAYLLLQDPKILSEIGTQNKTP